MSRITENDLLDKRMEIVDAIAIYLYLKDQYEPTGAYRLMRDTAFQTIAKYAEAILTEGLDRLHFTDDERAQMKFTPVDPREYLQEPKEMK
jgi:hypothetical protein